MTSTTIADLVATAEAAGLVLTPRPGGALYVAPRERITPALREALRSAKAEVITYIMTRDFETDWTRVRLADLDRIIEVAVPWSDVNLIIAPGCRIADGLRATDSTPGRVWCVCEVLDLLLIKATPTEAREVAEAKITLGGRVTAVRPIDARAQTGG